MNLKSLLPNAEATERKAKAARTSEKELILNRIDEQNMITVSEIGDLSEKSKVQDRLDVLELKVRQSKLSPMEYSSDPTEDTKKIKESDSIT